MLSTVEQHRDLHPEIRATPSFTGRGAALADIDIAIRLGEVAAITQPVAIHGLGGIGKSTLARQYAFEASQFAVFSGIWWLGAERDRTTGAFDGFEPQKIARYTDAKIAKLLKDEGIIRHRGKIEGAIKSARAYLDIMRVYRPGDGQRPGDRIFIFGFSRGAAIARLLARTIDQKGAPKKLWSLRLLGRHWTIWKSDNKQHDVPIAVLGCWDTVGAFGVAKKIAGIDFGRVNAFKDLSIPDNVKQAYHLVALDEQRDSFAPTLMDPDPLTPERIIAR